MLEVLEEEIIKLEEEGEDRELLQDMFRLAHTVKGCAGTIGHNRMSDLAHSMEDVFSGYVMVSLCLIKPLSISFLIRWMR